jgi:hypothetical protein
MGVVAITLISIRTTSVWVNEVAAVMVNMYYISEIGLTSYRIQMVMGVPVDTFFL